MGLLLGLLTRLKAVRSALIVPTWAAPTALFWAALRSSPSPLILCQSSPGTAADTRQGARCQLAELAELAEQRPG